MTTVREFTEAELNSMFYVVKNGKKAKVAKERVKKCKRTRPVWTDTVASGVTSEPPGSSRVEDLAKFYELAMKFDAPPSPFNF